MKRNRNIPTIEDINVATAKIERDMRIELVQRLNEATEDWLTALKRTGNESTWTDGRLIDIVQNAELLKGVTPWLYNKPNGTKELTQIFR